MAHGVTMRLNLSIDFFAVMLFPHIPINQERFRGRINLHKLYREDRTNKGSVERQWEVEQAEFGETKQ